MNPQSARQLLTPTARAMPKNEWQVTGYMVALVGANVGLTKRLSAQLGGLLPPFAMQEMWWGSAKLTLFERPTRAVAIGAAHLQNGIALGATSDRGRSVHTSDAAYALVTFGPPDRELNVGAGAIAFDRAGRRVYAEAFHLGGGLRLGSSAKLMTDNWFSGNGTASSVAIRAFRRHFAADLGVLAVHRSARTPSVLPVINVSWTFDATPNVKQP